jgi:hypothetical protein
MEIALSRKTVISIALALALLLVGGGGYYMWKNGLTSPTAAAAPAPSEPALAAIAALYSPDVNAGQAAWETKVCADMTADGCQLFKNMYSTPIWSAAQAGKLHAGISFSFVGVAEKLKNGEQVWKLSSSDALTPTIYIEVAQDAATHKWLLVRVLFDQEAKTRYGG